ncbi:hypothetical protein ACFL6W_10685 [Thermodesulfobacteriota bacterium]
MDEIYDVSVKVVSHSSTLWRAYGSIQRGKILDITFYVFGFSAVREYKV